MLFSLKDIGTAKLLQTVLNSHLSGIGSIKELKLNSREKCIDLVVVLVGEERPLEVRINEYELIKTDDQNYFIIKKVDFSREWVNNALQKWQPEMKIPLPAAAKLLL